MVCAFGSLTSLYAQNSVQDTVPFVRFGNISTKFTRATFELKKGNIVSNVLKVVNHDRREIRFTVDALFPSGWTRIDDASKVYNAQPRDTTIVPIIISPTKLVNGNTEIVINAFVINQDGQQIGNNFFTLTTKKKVAWGIDLKNNTTFYFKNEENERDFNFSVTNNGNYKQDIFLNFTNPRDDLILADTLSNPIKDPSRTFSLEAGESRDFYYRAIATTFNERNKQRISINNFSPITNRNRLTRMLLINSSEPRIKKTALQKKTKVNFVKLPNEIQVSPYGYPNLPLIMDLNAQNILNDRSFLSLNLQGFKQLNADASLIYFTQFNYSNSFFTNNVFKNAPWYVGYFDEKKSIEIGQVSGELIGTAAVGKGIKASYRFDDMHRAGVFYTNTSGFLNINEGITTFGGWYRLKYNEDIKLYATLGRSINNIADRKTTVATVQPSVRFLKKHSITFLGGMSNLEYQQNNLDIQRTGFLIGTNYAGSLLDRKLRTNLNVRFNDRNFSNGLNERLFITQRANYEFSKDWMGIMSSNFQTIKVYSPSTDQFLFDQQALFTNFSFVKNTETGTYQPGAFFEYRDFPNNAFVIRGLNFRYAVFSLEDNFLSSVFFRAGYARPRNDPDPKEFFSLETTGLFRYRTWNITARYNLGTFSAISLQQNQNDNLTPQSIRTSVQHQYLFPDRHYTLESNLIYSYNNIFRNHTLGLFPQLFYFTNSGWRFGIMANYVFTSSDFSSVFDLNDPNNPGQQNLGPTVNSNFNLNFSLRKEFGVPLPFIQKESATTEFVSFLDINGDGKKDKDETSLQNVVVKLNRNEVISNFEGEAAMKNLKLGKYKLEVLSLEKLNGWFPNVKDSIVILEDELIPIPFVRGVKVFGDVIVDRQKISVTDEQPLDLSRIKITAVRGDKVYQTLTNAEGRFEFYLPFGEYTITMDEGILSERFRITRNNLNVRLRNNQDGAYVSFYIVEKRRRVIFKDFTKKKN